MGKRTRKTRWRTLAIGDEQSDSEESTSTLDTRIPPTYHQKYYSRLSYSSQSTPTRRYQSDSTKSTRSSSTTSENKITFNEDEYTRITTPRQDVLFKKGYLNKPKTYSTQTSTGNSTTSTGNSTGNGTPDYQSTDLEYESHFVFPNGFLDQNGIYYVNSYDPYPLMVYNAPPYYNNDNFSRTKKYSTESLAETASPTNEETSPDAVNHDGTGPGDEIQHNPPCQENGHPHHTPRMSPPTEYGQVYNVVYPGFYYNGLCPPQDLANGQGHQSEPKRIKRRRRRKLSVSKADGQENGTTSEYTEDDVSSADEEEADEEEKSSEKTSSKSPPIEDHSTSVSPPSNDHTNENSESETQTVLLNNLSKDLEGDPVISDQVIVGNTGCDNIRLQNVIPESDSNPNDECVIGDTAENSLNLSNTNASEKKVKYDLKPDAQEFVPRAMRPETLQYYKIPPNFVPVPLLSPLGAQGYNHAYIPPGIPVNFIQQNHPVYPGYVPSYAHPHFNQEHVPSSINIVPNEEIQQPIESDTSNEVRNRNGIDIRTVVSKLEEVANEPVASADRRDRNQYNVSPNKKPGPHRHYDDRKKFFSKTNKQNGYYQKKPYNKFQTNGYNETQSNNRGEACHDVQECPRISEEQPAVVNGVDLDSTEIVDEDGKGGEDKVANTDSTEVPSVIVAEKPQELVIQNGVPIENINTHEINCIGSSTISDAPQVIKIGAEETKETYVNDLKNGSSVKMQSRPRRENPETRTPIRDNINNPTDPRKRCPRREDTNVLRKDQAIQHPEGRQQQYFKQNESPSHKFHKRFNPNSPARRPNNLPSGQSMYSSNENTKRYSETVKKQPQPFAKPTVREKIKTIHETKPVKPEVTNTLSTNTQWISVSNKKKKRNRNVEESEDGFGVAPEVEKMKGDAFEPNIFLQNMIVNGHPKIENLDETTIEKVEHITEVINKSTVKILEVRDLEKELLSNVGVEINEEKEALPPEDKTVQQLCKPKLLSKKKSKKGNQKQPAKRVIITDVDLSENLDITTVEEITEQTQVMPDTVKVNEIVENTLVSSEETKSVEVIATTEQEVPVDSSEKKSKKKKKKQGKITETSSSNMTLSSCEDTYDLLLENTFSNNSDDKTNMEISQELDLIIQRGMYNSLEEKIKSLNIIPIKEEFFQSVVGRSREPSMEKSPEFSKLLANSIPKFKYCMASVEDNTPKIPLPDLEQPSTSKKGLFSQNFEVNDLLKDISVKNGYPESDTIDITKKTSYPREVVAEIKKEKSVERKVSVTDSNVIAEPDKEKLYPITQAVKNWMTKTRENTPEVEILKSPSLIFKEFCENSADDQNCASCLNGKRNSTISESDEEVTVYSASRENSETVDLLDCWENEISVDSETKSATQNGCDAELLANGGNGEDKEVLEVYESKYGQNEDFLELQKEIEEKKKQESDARSRNFPKHGALPYRAICCNVM